MRKSRYLGCWASAIIAVLGSAACSKAPRVASPGTNDGAGQPGTPGHGGGAFSIVQCGMLEVTGGRFWKPYGESNTTPKTQPSAQESGATPAGMDPNLYQYRPPIDLTNARLRKLAAALGPAYVRVSRTWANTAYFHNSDQPAPKTPPKGFSGILTRPQWRGVIEFAQAVNAQLVTSFATNPGTRDTQSIWTFKQARQLLDYIQSVGGRIAAAEFMNEPTYAEAVKKSAGRVAKGHEPVLDCRVGPLA